MSEPFKKKITKDECRDTGMAMVLLLLLLQLKYRREGLILAAAALHVLNMLLPRIYLPIAVVWMGFSQLLGKIVPNVLLSILYFGVLTPIGMLRRLMGKDSLKLRAFKAGEESVAVARNHSFTARDLEKPY